MNNIPPNWVEAEMHYRVNKHSDEFYEKQARLLNCQNLLQSAVEEIEDIQEFNDLKDYIKIALEEVKEEEKKYG